MLWATRWINNRWGEDSPFGFASDLPTGHVRTGTHSLDKGVDGIHFGVRLEDAAQCILVVIGATAEGNKELLALADGYRESEASWREVLLDLKARGLSIDPHLATGDGYTRRLTY